MKKTNNVTVAEMIARVENNGIQTVTSADTSINTGKKGKLPAIYSLLPRAGVNLESGVTALDYGCGKHFDAYHLPETVRGFDKYSRQDYEVLTHHYEVGINSNVLNVIPEREERINMLSILKDLCDTVYITVYEGTKGKEPGISREDCWQENRSLKSYEDEIREVFPEVVRKYGMFICK